MSRIMPLMLVLVLLVASWQPVYGQDPLGTLEDRSMTPSVIPMADPLDIWNRYRDAVVVSGGAPDAMAKRELGELVELRKELGIERLELMSMALAQQSREMRAQGATSSAAELLTRAIELDPGSRLVYSELVESTARQGVIGVFEAIVIWFKSFGAYFSSFWAGLSGLGDLYVLALGWLVAGSSLYLVVLLCKSNGLVRHDVGELLPDFLPDMVANAIGVLIMLLPLILGLGLVWWIGFWIVLCYAYGKKVEKAIVILLALFIAAAPYLTGFAGGFLNAYDSAFIHAVLNAEQGKANPQVVEALEQWVQDNPEDVDAGFYLALLQKRRDQFYDARVQLEKILQVDSRNAAAQVNLGNVLFALGDTTNAAKYYEAALSSDPLMASAHYNLGLVKLEKFEFEKAQAHFSEAKRIDPAKVRRFERLNDAQGGRPPADETLDPKLLWHRVFQFEGPYWHAGQRTWNEDFWGTSLANTTMFGIAVIVMAVVFEGVRRKTGLAQHCVMCGRSTCLKCQRHQESDKYCAQCMQLFVKREGVPPETKARKLAQVRSYERYKGFRDRIASLLVPGAGHTLQGRVTLGAFLIVVWGGLLLRWSIGPHPVAMPGQPVEATLIGWGLLLIITVGVYLYANANLSKAE